MATTYAALVSLMNLLTRIQHPTCPASFNQPQLKSLFDKVTSLVDFLEAYSQRTSKHLLTRMADAAFAAEDKIESYYVDQVSARSASSSADTGYELLCQGLDHTILAMELIIEEAMQYELPSKRKKDEKDQLPRAGPVVVQPASGRTKMVGFDEELICLLDQLTSHQAGRQTIPIVGMGGIGKTCLARNVFDSSLAKHNFDIRGWVTVSQVYNVDQVIRSLLTDINVGETNGDLRQRLYQGLCGRKYLIVLDDIWDNLLWGGITRLFPDYNNGSRIVFTTRIRDLALSIGSCSPHEMKLLDYSKSWDLLSETVFGEEVCPPELTACGEKIAENCRGLPLTITVVGGLLKMSNKTLGYWESVAENVKSFMNMENDQHCSEILSLSYNHLPIHLKPCFLYMATFKEDRKLSVFNIVTLWVSDGFLMPRDDITLEEVALQYLNDLINRNLVMVAERGVNGKITYCLLHDLLWEICLREAQNERFLFLLKNDVLDLPQRLYCERRLVCNLNGVEPHLQLPPMPAARSLCVHWYVSKSGQCLLDMSSCKLLRVLFGFLPPRDYLHLVNLRFLVRKVDVSRFTPPISLLWTLEFALFSGSGELILPTEFWELPNLRHLISGDLDCILPEPTDAQSSCVLSNLQTLETVWNFNATNVVLDKIPNLKSLRATYELDYLLEDVEKISRYFENLACHHKLEKLTCSFETKGEDEDQMCVFYAPENLKFSSNLRALSLDGSAIPWEYMSIIGSLPNLEELRLSYNAFCGVEWNSTEGDFRCLKLLRIAECDLKNWTAESSHFPRLVRLELVSLDLEEIPLDLGDVGSLRSIYLYTDKKFKLISAKEILEEREDQGIDDLVIEGFYYGDWLEEFSGFSNKNFRVRFA